MQQSLWKVNNNAMKTTDVDIVVEEEQKENKENNFNIPLLTTANL